MGRGRVKTPILPENGCAQRDVRRLVRFWPLRMPEKSTKISMAYYSPEFSHNLGRVRPQADAAIRSVCFPHRAVNFAYCLDWEIRGAC
jgi:hypothetical protein